MPPLASVTIPVINLSQSSGSDPPLLSKGKAPVRQIYNPRTYDNEPLPIKPSAKAPRNAKIIGRVLDPYGATYQLKIGDVEINDVGVDEILDYVSAVDLEEYENRQFEEEREVLNVVEMERERLRREKLERMKVRAKRKGLVLYEDVDVTNEETEGAELDVGRHGRARPTYTQFYKKPRMRGKMKRDPGTGDVLPVSADDEASSASQEDLAGPATIIRPQAPLTELPKRRRRKRDKVTGELLALSPAEQKANKLEANKRQRRRRHPVTGQLMPIGWRYDPNESHEIRRAEFDSPSFKRLSISQEHDAKRQRLDIESSMSRSSSPMPTKAEIAAQMTPSHIRTPKKEATVHDLLTSADELEPVRTAPTSAKRLPPSLSKRSALSNNRMLPSAITSSAQESSPEPASKTSIMQPTARTSIVSPMAIRASSTEAPAQQSEDEEESEEDLDDDEWFIEGILAHCWSDPVSHPEELGTEPVMLYQVKWEGYETPTWEPIKSFGDPGLVRAYREKVGLDPDNEGDEAMRPGAHTERRTQPVTTNNAREDSNDEDEDVDEGEYEVQAILAHSLTDPENHPAQLGNAPVMIYLVKWKDLGERSWEPAWSFKDKRILNEYRRRVGLEKPRGEGSGDGEVVMM